MSLALSPWLVDSLVLAWTLTFLVALAALFQPSLWSSILLAPPWAFISPAPHWLAASSSEEWDVEYGDVSC